MSWKRANAASDSGLALLAGGASSVIPAWIRVKLSSGSPKRSEVNLTRSLSAPFIAGIEALVAIALNWLEPDAIPNRSFKRRTRWATSVPLAPVYVWASSKTNVTTRSSAPASQTRVASKMGLSMGRTSMYSSME